MRLINKQTEPANFTSWKAEHPTLTFATIDYPIKQELKNSLLTEQHHVCCYCENEIGVETSHVEHLLPQSAFPNAQLDYLNLMVSCEGGARKGNPAEHCGHKKKSQILPISPLAVSDPASNFIYAGDGKIYPNLDSNTSSKDTISILGLNARRLINMRKAAISVLLTEPLERWNEIATICKYPNANNKFPAFSSAMQYQIRTVIGEL